MKSYNSITADKLVEYMKYRLSLGYKKQPVYVQLGHFDRYVIEHNADWSDFTPLFFLKFRAELKGTGLTINRIINSVRGFFTFLVRQEYIVANPLLDIPAKEENAFIPFIFSTDEVDQLLQVIQGNIRQTEKYFFRDLTVYLTLLFLARCGLRISEPLRLLTSSYRPGQATVYIEKTKFHKDRLIPIPLALARETDNYLALRSGCVDMENPYLLAGTKSAQITRNYICPSFDQAVKDIGLAGEKRIIAGTTFGKPTPHSLRHSFAINTLKNIKKRGADPQKALPVLATYMGHQKYQYTALYLKMLDAGQRKSLVDFASSLLD